MKHSRAELKAELMAQAELLIDDLLDWNESASQPTLTQIEDVILKLRQRWSEHMATAVIADQDATRPVPGPLCPTCQREMHYKHSKLNTVASRVGSLKLQRAYYYCRHCQVGVFPPR